MGVDFVNFFDFLSNLDFENLLLQLYLNNEIDSNIEYNFFK